MTNPFVVPLFIGIMSVTIICLSYIITETINRYSNLKAEAGEVKKLRATISELRTEQSINIAQHAKKVEELLAEQTQKNIEIYELKESYYAAIRNARWSAEVTSREISRLQYLLNTTRRTSNQFTQEEINRLIRLCHPDKHDNSKISNEITSKLISMRQE